MEAPKVSTLDFKNRRKPTVTQTDTADDDHNLSVIDPGRDKPPHSDVCSPHVSYITLYDVLKWNVSDVFWTAEPHVGSGVS